jgi:hypothetical protein
VLPHERKLLTDQQLRDASFDQLEDLVQRINLFMQWRGEPGLVWQTSPDYQPTSSGPPGPGASGSQ